MPAPCYPGAFPAKRHSSSATTHRPDWAIGIGIGAALALGACIVATAGICAGVAAGIAGAGILAGVIKVGQIGISATSTGVGVGLSTTLGSTFRGGSYTARILADDTVLYRAGTAEAPFGQFFSVEPPAGVLQTRIDKAIPPVWPTGTQAPIATGYAIEFPAGTRVYEGIVANQGGVYVGGTTQVVIPEAWNVPGAKVVDSWPLK